MKTLESKHSIIQPEQLKPPYNVADVKKENNKMIVEAQLNVSLKNGPSVMSLLFRTALEEINKQLPNLSNENPIQKAYNDNVDVSPQETAKRIVKGATAFFNAYQEQHSELSKDEALEQFMSTIRAGIDTGFGEAKGILEGLSVLEGEIASSIDSTYTYVEQGLTDFNQKITQELTTETKE